MSLIKMNPKGQIVIPCEMTDSFGNTEVVVKQNDKRIIIEKMDSLTEKQKEDLEFARRTEEAWKRYEKGEFIEMDEKEFFEELEKW